MSINNNISSENFYLNSYTFQAQEQSPGHAIPGESVRSRMIYTQREERKHRFSATHPYQNPSQFIFPQIFEISKEKPKWVEIKESYYVYIGESLNGKKHGKGVFTFTSGSYYDGDWFEDKKHGFGKEITLDKKGYFVEGYEGNWVADHMEGYGRFIYENGSAYHGEWVNGKKEGNGKYICSDRLFYEGKWKNDVAQSDASNLGDELFFNILCENYKSESGPPNGYCLGIMADYLQKNGYEHLGDALSEAHELLQLGDSEIQDQIDSILKSLVFDKKPRLFFISIFGHAMGLNLVPDRNSESVVCEIFNSGDGLDYHQNHPTDPRKYKTMMQVRIPITSLNRDMLEKITNTFSSVNDFYDWICDGAEVIPPDSSPWQTMQTGDDCSLRWILAFCKSKMSPEEYKIMLSNLKMNCRRENMKQLLSLFIPSDSIAPKIDGNFN